MAVGTVQDRIGPNRLPIRSRDRRPALAALALLLIVGGGLGAGLIVYRTGQHTDVLMASREIKPGQRVTAADFETARVSSDSGGFVPASRESAFVGTYATSDIPQGTIVNGLMFKAGRILPPNGVVVGVSLSASQRPAGGVSAGDVVRVYYIAKGSSSDTAPQTGQTLANAVRVVSVQGAGSTGGTDVTVSLLMLPQTAQAVVSPAAAGDVALAELPLGTAPEIDFQVSK